MSVTQDAVRPSLAVDPAGTGRTRGRVDVGRVAVVVLFGWTAFANVVGVARQLGHDGSAWPKVAGTGGSLLGLAFCALVVRAYLRRGPARATDRGLLVVVAAPLGTVLPMVLAAVPPASTGAVRDAAVLVLTIAGLGWSLWALRALSTNLSVLPQARAAVTSGPYRWVRHPLYLGEIVAVCGLALHVGRWAAAGVVALEIALQIYRARREERLLSRQLPAYDEYAVRTRRLVPGVW